MFLLDNTIGGALVQMETAHYLVHQRGLFNDSYCYSSVANNEIVDSIISTPTNKELHTVFIAGAGGNTKVMLYSSPTITATGATGYPQNRYREDPTSALYKTSFSGVATVAVSHLFCDYIFGGNSPTTRVGANGRPGTEWVLDKGATYLLRMQNSSGGAIPMHVGFECYAL